MITDTIEALRSLLGKTVWLRVGRLPARPYVRVEGRLMEDGADYVVRDDNDSAMAVFHAGDVAEVDGHRIRLEETP